MIEFEHVSKEYYPYLSKESKVALKDISFKIKDGEFVILCGRSGSGKTTILKLITCEERPTKGRVFFDKKDLSTVKKSEAYLIRQKIGSIYQDFKLLSYKTVFENVAYALETLEYYDEERIKKEVNQVIELVGLENRINCFPHELSGGEQQRVSIARALINRPEVILADEPTGNLDPYNTRDIIKILLKINEAGSTVILSTHDKEVVNALKKRVITLKDGMIVRDEEEGVYFL
ncbi:MAG TPA: ATP-binding cassette domain-containing protein [Candidatus Pacearchaeota archaeon]|nr:ATP-binding cassette domain-containing protein [Candidatus Pacearchaeota archaeon]HQK58718.1 ATP-binding cassette domain-containing protein [Candidatus Pacearchaeota archaeon]